MTPGALQTPGEIPAEVVAEFYLPQFLSQTLLEDGRTNPGHQHECKPGQMEDCRRPAHSPVLESSGQETVSGKHTEKNDNGSGIAEVAKPNAESPPQSLDQDEPEGRPVRSAESGNGLGFPAVHGLHHCYLPKAA